MLYTIAISKKFVITTVNIMPNRPCKRKNIKITNNQTTIVMKSEKIGDIKKVTGSLLSHYRTKEKT